MNKNRVFGPKIKKIFRPKTTRIMAAFQTRAAEVVKCKYISPPVFFVKLKQLLLSICANTKKVELIFLAEYC